MQLRRCTISHGRRRGRTAVHNRLASTSISGAVPASSIPTARLVPLAGAAAAAATTAAATVANAADPLHHRRQWLRPPTHAPVGATSVGAIAATGGTVARAPSGTPIRRSWRWQGRRVLQLRRAHTESARCMAATCDTHGVVLRQGAVYHSAAGRTAISGTLERWGAMIRCRGCGRRRRERHRLMVDSAARARMGSRQPTRRRLWRL